jgi:DNA-directed RNA polymerase
VQHLSALSRDEIVAPLVNLVHQALPGDVYKYIAGFVWEELATMADRLTQKDKDAFEGVFARARELQSAYNNAPPNSEAKVRAWGEAKEWRNANRDLRARLFPVYWLAINNPKDQRKVVKRNVMTLGYGGTAYGMGQQIIDDTRDMSEYLRDKEHLWGALLGNLVFATCYRRLPGPARMLRLFQELADRCNEKAEDLCWTVPVTGFPVVQSYREPTIKRAKLTYGDDELKVQLESWDDSRLDKEGQRTGTAPNVVHSFDAGHLGMVVAAASYPISVVHDSFGCHAGNMGDLFMLVREQFVKFYAHDPLLSILTENDAADLLPDRGSLDVNQILFSDYAFC